MCVVQRLKWFGNGTNTCIALDASGRGGHLFAINIVYSFLLSANSNKKPAMFIS